MPPFEADILYRKGLALHEAGQVADADSLYKQALTADPRHADSLHMSGVAAAQRGQLDAAAASIARAIEISGENPAYHVNLASIQMGRQKVDLAVHHYEHAVRLDPENPEIQHSLGAAYKAASRLAEAAAACERAITLRPDYAQAFNTLGSVYFRQGGIEEAVPFFARAVALKPDYAEAFNNLGNALREIGHFDNALLACRRAVELKPDFAEAYNNLGNTLKDLDRLDDAIAAYERAVALKPDMAETYNNLGNALKNCKRYEDAVASCRRALALKPDYAEAQNNLGNSLAGLGRQDEAATCYETAIALAPELAEAHSNLGAAYVARAQPDKAVTFYETAIALKPEYVQAHANAAFARLVMGDFETGWREHEWRLKAQKIAPQLVEAPMWNGGDLHGRTLLLHGEQGLGDHIQFVRYVAEAQKKGGRVFLYCLPALLPLFTSLENAPEIFTDVQMLPRHDFQASLMSVPYLMRTRLETIPATVPYLHANRDRQEVWRNRLSSLPKRRIGLVWRGNPNHSNDRNRSMTAELFSGFLTRPDLGFVVVQKDSTLEEIEALAPRASLYNAAPEIGDLADTAALLATLDLVIAVDTAVCHLAGALGVPVWTLVPFAPDWRWLVGRTDSPWYPTMRLFRQPAAGDWASVAQDVRDALSLN